MNKQQEALKLALEALEGVATWVEVRPKTHPWDTWKRVAPAINAIREALAEQPEFIKHEVANAEDWSEWVCPDPKGYLMKCCDCGLVHEAQFGVVRYKSETEREDCDMVDDPNLQAVFRMRRSEQWSPKDMAYRPGGLPLAEQPAQEPVAWRNAALRVGEDLCSVGPFGYYDMTAEQWLDWALSVVTVHAPPASKPWVGLTDEDIRPMCKQDWVFDTVKQWAQIIEAKLREKNA